MDERLFSFQSELEHVAMQDVTLRDNSKLFKFLVSTRDYHGTTIDPLFKKHLKSWENKEVRWRHKDDPELFIGEVRKIWNENGSYFGALEIFGDHEIQLKVQEAIEKSIAEGNPIGASTNYLVLSKNKKPVSIYNREISVTDAPKCVDCRVMESLNENENEENTMAEKDNPWTALGQDAFTSIKNENETLKKKQVETNVLVEELNDKLVNLANEKTALSEKITELENQLTEKEKTITEKDEELAKFKNEMEVQTEKMPLITELLGFDNPENDEDKETLIEKYKGFSTDQLTFMRDKIKGITEEKTKADDKDKKIQDIPTNADVTGELSEDLRQKISEMTPEEFAISLNPGAYPEKSKKQ